MTKNPLSFLFAGFRYLLHCFSAGRLFDRCRFGRLSRRIFWETAAADAVVLLLTFFVPLEIAYRLQLEPESLFLRVWLCTWLILFAVLSVCLFSLKAVKSTLKGFAHRTASRMPDLAWLFR